MHIIKVDGSRHISLGDISTTAEPGYDDTAVLKKCLKKKKFSAADLEERTHWDRYRQCYEDAINNTGSAAAPWYVIPADNKWYARLMVSQIITDRMAHMDLHYPRLTPQQIGKIREYKENL